MPGSVVPKVTTALVSAPLPLIVQKLGVSIAEAQKALDENSIAIAQSMAESNVTVGNRQFNLLSLGFTPTFYAFTEATVESKLSFTMKEEKEIGVSAGAGVQIGVFAASVDVSYARKFSVSSEGSSSLAARLVSLPPPDTLMQVLKSQFNIEPPTE